MAAEVGAASAAGWASRRPAGEQKREVIRSRVCVRELCRVIESESGRWISNLAVEGQRCVGKKAGRQSGFAPVGSGLRDRWGVEETPCSGRRDGQGAKGVALEAQRVWEAPPLVAERSSSPYAAAGPASSATWCSASHTVTAPGSIRGS